jgi:hypothetical protein
LQTPALFRITRFYQALCAGVRMRAVTWSMQTDTVLMLPAQSSAMLDPIQLLQRATESQLVPEFFSKTCSPLLGFSLRPPTWLISFSRLIMLERKSFLYLCACVS